MHSLRERLAHAKTRLLLDAPYFGTLAGRLETQPDDDIPAFLSDGTQLRYNPDYLGALDDDALAFVLANGAMHAALAHETRREKRHGWLWQLATDHAVNALLLQNGFTLPPQVVYDPRFDGMYAEEIYRILKDEIKNEAYDDDPTNETGFNEENQRKRDPLHHAKGDHDPDKKRPTMEVENVPGEQLFEHFERQLRERLEKRGELPVGIERFFAPAKTAVIDWRHELSHALSRHLRSDYRLMPPSKKLLYDQIYLPSATSETLEAVLAIDSSGSVDDILLGRFIAEIESLLETFNDYRIDLLVCDAKIQRHRHCFPGESLEPDIVGGGGTDFRPVFAWIENYRPHAELLLYFTDLDGRFPDVPPYIDTVWIVPSSDRTAPFGHPIVIGKT